jgi:15-cis-phytoene synthase
MFIINRNRTKQLDKIDEDTMSSMQAYWESHLLSFVDEALKHRQQQHVVINGDQKRLGDAYRHCANITSENSRTFYMAASLLPDEKRHAVHALYAFCRVSDDMVDCADSDVEEQLTAWRQRSVLGENADSDSVALAWIDTSHRYLIPPLFADQLLEGVSKDLRKVRYNTFDELAEYCYGVACTVGLMSMHITGYQGPEAFPYAIRLGVALQMTNILRDIGEDWRIGRLYLPKEEMDAFGLSEDDIARGQVTEKWIRFMRFQIDRTRRLYASAMPGIGMLNADGRFAIAAAAELYQGILSRIEDNNYDVFHKRAFLTKWEKVRSLPGIWIRARNNRYPVLHQVEHEV